jgi:hypothetical protein
MDQPYRPPAAEVSESEPSGSVSRKRCRVVVSFLGAATIFVGVGLVVFLKDYAFEFRLQRGNFPAGFPGFLRTLVNEYPAYPVWAGILLASVALVFAQFGRLTPGLVSVLLAMGVTGGWAGVLLAVISHWIRDFAR